MRIGIDTYSYHRYLGESYPVQTPPDRLMPYEDILQRALAPGIDGISIETCFFDQPATGHAVRLVAMAREAGCEAILAWGHPLGLHGGESDDAQADLEATIRLCGSLGITTLRIVGSNRRLMAGTPKDTQRRLVAGRLASSVRIAEDEGVVLAIENHQDFLAEDILMILEEVNSPNLGVNYDTGNSLRLNEDPLHAATLLAPHITATHIKDVRIVDGGDPDAWTYYATVPAGRGIVDLPGVLDVIEAAGFRGFHAVELDYLHPDYPDEFRVMEESIRYLKNLREQRT